MKFDALKQFAKLRQQLMEEKSQLETRLNEINQVLGNETAPSRASQLSPALEASPRPISRPGRKPRTDNSMSLREAVLKALSSGPLARKDLVGAVQNVGYVFTTKNPLNSIGSVLYGKNSPIKSKAGRFYLPGNAATDAGASNGDVPAPAQPKKRKMSAAGRARIAAAARAMWAKRKAAR